MPLEAGARQDTPILVHLLDYADTFEMLYALGRFRPQVLQLLRAYAPTRNDVLGPGFRTEHYFRCQAFMDATRRWTSRLHYFQFLPAERVAKLLAGRADVHANDGGENAPTPIGLAWALLDTGATDTRAELVVNGWSPATHALFPAAARARAVELLLASHLLARSCQESSGQGTALLDVWVAHVMPRALHR